MQRIKILLFFFVSPAFLFAQDNSNTWAKKLESYKLQPIVGFQIWTPYTIGTEVYDTEKGVFEAADNRLGIQLRRTRLGIKGQPYENLKFNLITSLDFIGKDVLDGTEAVQNNGASPRFRIWNAYIQWRLKPQSEALNIVAGYFPAQIGRESITAALRVPSMEKSWSQNYMRRHIVGVGPGRVMGFNFGGLLGDTEHSINFKYDLGLFNSLFQSFGGNSQGLNASPLVVGRLLINLGDPESNTYTIGHKVNYFGERNGLSIAIAGSTQGKTDLFESNQALGGDFLWNWDKLNVDGEWTWMRRTGLNVGSNREFSVLSNTGYLRLSYNVDLKQDYILEPAIMLVQYNGATTASDQINAVLVNSLSGKDQILDLGANFYFNPNLKLSLHYTLRKGDGGERGDNEGVNNYFFQPGLGVFRRGDWLGLGLVAVL